MKDNFKISTKNDSLLVSMPIVKLVDIVNNTYIIKDSSKNMFLGIRGSNTEVSLNFNGE